MILAKSRRLLASIMGYATLLRDARSTWEQQGRERSFASLGAHGSSKGGDAPSLRSEHMGAARRGDNTWKKALDEFEAPFWDSRSRFREILEEMRKTQD